MSAVESLQAIERCGVIAVNRFTNRAALRQQNIDLTQLRDDLFGFVLLLGHSKVLSKAQ